MANSCLVHGRWIVTGADADDPTIDDGALLISDGRITELGGWRDLRASHPDLPVIGSERVAVMPGLINAHHHSAAPMHGCGQATWDLPCS
jgi:cytosine/adenosine deaminase-related metal-dependent hydrolase